MHFQQYSFDFKSDNILKPIFISINNIQLIFKWCFNLFLTLFENDYAQNNIYVIDKTLVRWRAWTDVTLPNISRGKSKY